jgi:hypothetical protein
MEVAMTFTLRVPDSENPHLRSEAVAVSRHVSRGAAHFAFLRHQLVAERQGFHSEAFIWDEERGCVVEGPGVELDRLTDGDRETMNDFEETVVNWCRKRRVGIQFNLDMLEAGGYRIGKDVGTGWVDITDEQIALLKAQIAEIDRFI